MQYAYVMMIDFVFWYWTSLWILFRLFGTQNALYKRGIPSDDKSFLVPFKYMQLSVINIPYKRICWFRDIFIASWEKVQQIWWNTSTSVLDKIATEFCHVPTKKNLTLRPCAGALAHKYFVLPQLDQQMVFETTQRHSEVTGTVNH